MEMTPVESSMFRGFAYDPSAQVLTVEFKNGGLYRYSGVPLEEFTALTEAESKGKHFAAHIRGKYDSQKLEH